MLLADAVEVNDFMIEIVQDFHLGWGLSKEYLRSTRECLDVRQMLRKYFNHPLCQPVLPTYVRKRSSHFLVSTKSLPGLQIASAEAHMPKRGFQSIGLPDKEKVCDVARDASAYSTDAKSESTINDFWAT